MPNLVFEKGSDINKNKVSIKEILKSSRNTHKEKVEKDNIPSKNNEISKVHISESQKRNQIHRDGYRIENHGKSMDIPKVKGMEKEIDANKLIFPKPIGVINTKRPAFLQMVRTSDQKEHLVVSCFDPFKNYHSVKVISDIEQMFTNNQKPKKLEVKELTKAITWPNDITKVPEKMFGKEGFLVAGGFMVWPYNTGEVSFVELETGIKTKLTQEKKGWFYHRAVPYDLNNDGNIGILTARSHASTLKMDVIGELVWLEKPKEAGKPWKEHILLNGPDVHFDLADINGDGKQEIISTEFFNSKLSVTYDEKGKLNRRVIDKDIQHPFDVKIVDLNNDGKKEVLVTDHVNKGGVFVYEIPSDIKNGKWEKHVLADGFKTRIPLPSEHAPGKAIPFYPNKNMKGKPFIIVAGDGTGKVHLLVPKKPEDSKNWEYDEKILYKGNCTIGKIEVDYDKKDGFAKIFVPLYEKDKILVYSYNHDDKQNEPINDMKIEKNKK